MNRHPRGLIKFAVMERTPEKLEELWGQMQKYARWCLTDTHNQKEQLAQNMMNPNSLYYDVLENGRTVGFISYHLESPWVAVEHALFFDGVMRGRETQVRKLNERLLKEYGWALIRTYLPPGHTTSVSWAKRLGFQIDGTMRGTILIGGQPRDLLILTFPPDVTHRVAMGETPRWSIVQEMKEDAVIVPSLQDSQADAMEHYLSQNGG